MENRHKYYKEIIAFAEGKTIQSIYKGEGAQIDRWKDDNFPLWNNPLFEFRIKPEPKYVPFTFEDREELRGKWVRDKENQNEFMIHLIVKKGVNGYTWRGSLAYLEFIDGTPFGKIKKNEE